MTEHGTKNPSADLSQLGLNNVTANWNMDPKTLVDKTIELGQGSLADSGALMVDTGEFTGRSPKDRFIVKDSKTENTVDWNNINIAFDADKFDQLYNKLINYLNGKEIWVRDAFACADPDHRLNIRVINENPWSNLFAHNLFQRPTETEIQSQNPDWTIIQAPGFTADAAVDGTRQHNFAVVNFTKQMIIIGGTAYTGEMKKGIFSVLNYLLPQERGVLSMHCSANVGKDGDTAIFFC